jgi:glycosyltransferase involved in cell wall biosynthesis
MSPETSRPNLSVIVPIGNFEDHLSSITAIIEGARDIHAELILVIDSQPNSVQTLAESLLAQLRADGSVATVECKNPGGARNKGLGLATKDWVAFWDCDDLPNPTGFLEMVLRAEKSDCTMAIGSYEVQTSSTGQIVNEPISRKTWQIEIGLNPGIWRFAFKRDLISSTNFPNLSMGEDQIFVQRILAKNPRVLIYEESVYKYMVGIQNQLTSIASKILDLAEANRIAKLEFSSNGAYNQVIKIMIARQSLTLSLQNNLTSIFRLKSLTRALKYFTFHPGISLKILKSSSRHMLPGKFEGYV